MKTKTYYFTKIITFCVLSLFLITNMILFTSCDNGNSPNNNTNEEQNNNAPTDYCKICDGVQDKEHQHDYCGECEGIQDKNHQHEQGGTENEDGTITETTYPDWFKETTIGGEGSPYRALCIDSIKYNEENPYTTEVKRFNNYQNQYKSFIEGLEFSDEFIKQFPEIKNINFAEFAEYNVNDKISYKESFDQLIGSTTDSKNGSINDVCKPAIEKIINNVGSGDTAAVDKAYFAIYYKAIANEAYRNGYNGEFTTKNQNGTYDTNDTNQMKNQYNKEKNKCIELCGGDEYLPFENKYFYDETGKINPEVLKQFDDMIITVAENLKNSGTNVTPDDLRNIINLSLTASSIEGMHDYLSSTLLVNEHTHTDECYNNEIYEKVIEPIAFPTVSMTQHKLNKLNFSHDYGRELV